MKRPNEDASNKDLIESLLDAIAGAILILNPDGKILVVNQAASRMLNKPKNELIGVEFSFPFAVGESDEMEVHMPNAEVRYVYSQVSEHSWENEKAYFVTLLDITKYKQLLKKLQVADTVFRYAKEGIIVTNKEGDIISVNDEFCKITGYSEQEVTGKNPSILKSDKQDTQFYQDMWESIKRNGFWVGQIWNKNKNNEVYPELLAVSEVRNEVGQVTNYVGVFYNISKQVEEQNRTIHRIQFYDELTGLPNRVLLPQLLDEKIKIAVSNNENLALVKVDVDDYSNLADEYGQEFGAKLLQHLSHVLYSCLQINDILARTQNDVFAAVLTHLQDKLAYTRFINMVNRRLASPISIDGKEVKISVSFGVTVLQETQPQQPEQMLKQAARAVYQAKLKGYNKCVVFDPQSETKQIEYNIYLDKLIAAMHHGEFELYCQPKINLQTNAVVGVEALVRWNHPGKGVLNPGVFLPTASSSEFELQLDKWVIEYCLEHFLFLGGIGDDLSVSVNINVLDLEEKSFIAWLSKLAQQQPNGKFKNLEFEILETSAITDLKHLAYLIKKANKLGLTFSLDDFGTAYSSLAYLKNLPLEYMKIDQDFVRNCVDSVKDREILQGILALAEAINVKVVAEGAETDQHLDMLREMGADCAQGYAIAKPMPLKEFIKWREAWNKKHHIVKERDD